MIKDIIEVIKLLYYASQEKPKAKEPAKPVNKYVDKPYGSVKYLEDA